MDDKTVVERDAIEELASGVANSSSTAPAERGYSGPDVLVIQTAKAEMSANGSTGGQIYSTR